MTKNRPLPIKKFAQLIILLGLVLTVAGCATRMPDMGNRSDGRFEVPEYVRNLPKSRTGNMAQYTVFGKQYRVMDTAANFTQTGQASWYGKKFHGRKTSSGEIYDMYAMTAAHKHLPIPTFVRVTNLENGKSIVVKVNDRGPFVGERIIDLSYVAALELDMAEQGVARVKVDALSTHHVAENLDSNQAVAQLIDGTKNADGSTAPVVIAPAVAAVPLPVPAQMVQQNLDAESGSVAGTAVAAVKVELEPADADAVVIDGSEDGFVELTASDNNYFIQLGAFSHAPNASALVDDVTSQVGLPAYVEQDGTRNMFRVKMGPFKQGVLLENTLSELANLGIEGYTLQAASR